MSTSKGPHPSGRFGEDEEHVGRNGSPGAGGDGTKGANGTGNGASGKGSANRRSLSEISHLFLSDLRQLNGGGRPAPQRIPPGGEAPKPLPLSPAPAGQPHEDLIHNFCTDHTVDATPQEFFSGNVVRSHDARDEAHVPPASAVIGARLSGTLIRRACQFAAGLATDRPVGLIVVQEAGVRLISVEAGAEGGETDLAAPETIDDPEALRAALLEMSCDLERWLVVLPDPRLPQARRLLAQLGDWILLATADHEGVVASYRTLKALCDLELGDDEGQGPAVTLALVDAACAADAQRHARKLVGVCRQFLDLEIEPAGALPGGERRPATAGAVSNVESFTATELVCASWETPEEASAAWPVIEAVLGSSQPIRPPQPPQVEAHWSEHFTTSFASGEYSMFHDSRSPNIPDSAIPPIARPIERTGERGREPQRPLRDTPADAAWTGEAEIVGRRPTPRPAQATPAPEQVERRLVDHIQVPDLARPAGTNSPAAPAMVVPPVQVRPAEPAQPIFREAAAGEEVEVIDLPAGESVAEAVLARLGVAMTPVTPPMLPGARLCVARDGRIVLVASAAPGLSDLPAIGRAMAWAVENRALLRMALAQYRLDDAADVSVHLLVSCDDAGADALRPLLGTGRVTVQAYRRLTWGGRSGVLLEAA